MRLSTSIPLTVLFVAFLSGIASDPLAPKPASAQSLEVQPTRRLRARELQRRIEEEQQQLELRRASIEQVLSEPPSGGLPDWAGKYYCGDGLGMNVEIAIAPDVGVTYTWRGCLGLYDANHGEIREVGEDRIVVDLAIDQSLSDWRFMSDELFIVRSGDHTYLIPKSSLGDAYDTMAKGHDRGLTGRSLIAPLKSGDEDKQGETQADWPKEFLAAREHPVRATVTEISQPTTTRDGLYTTTAWSLTINAGANLGLQKGMPLDVGQRWLGHVSSTQENTSIVLVEQTWRDAPTEDAPKVGWSCSCIPWLYTSASDL